MKGKCDLRAGRKQRPPAPCCSISVGRGHVDELNTKGAHCLHLPVGPRSIIFSTSTNSYDNATEPVERVQPLNFRGGSVDSLSVPSTGAPQ